MNSYTASYSDDVAFLKQHTKVIELKNADGARLAVIPAWQGRAMTSTTGDKTDMSFGWINRELIASRQLLPHINVFGGEDRFWLGPEGGQYSIFFAKGAKFELNDWQTPASIDTIAYEVKKQSATAVEFGAAFTLTNYSDTVFQVKVEREIQLLPTKEAWKTLGVRASKSARIVGFESKNELSNAGSNAWEKETGLLSIWILGMFNPSPETTIVVPLRKGSDAKLGKKVTSDYFGEVPPERLVVKDNVIFFSADGRFRSKIGLSPRRSLAVLGSYDAKNKVLTVVRFTQPREATDYVNSLWKLQDQPYAGDAANAYNDGPASPGAKPMGPFYELESSSPAAKLKPGKSLTHVHRTIHVTGEPAELSEISRHVLGVSLEEIASATAK